MAQTPGTSYADLDLDPSKRPDFIFAIAGWPTLYSVNGAYSVPGAGGDLNTTKGFTAVKKWARLPSNSPQKMKTAYPEGGGTSVGAVAVQILDKYDLLQTRTLSDLISREAYLEGTSTGRITTLTGDHTPATTTINVGSTTGYANGDLLYISQECIKIGTVATGTQFTGCTRAHLLTSPATHLNGVKVYSFKPATYLSKAFIYKGYQELTLDQFLPAFGGTIVGETKTPGVVGFELRASTWEATAAKRKTIINLTPPAGAVGFGPQGYTATAVGAGDYDIAMTVDGNKYPAPTGFGDGHYMVKVAGVWCGIKAINSESTAAGVTSLNVRVVKGLGQSSFEFDTSAGLDVPFGWSNVNFTTVPLVGQDPITFLLQILLSTGTGNNTPGGTNYDVLKRGIGLGIPYDRVDITSFENIRDNDYDYDPSTRVFFLFERPEPALGFIEAELCKPFGWYLMTGNDGKIKLVKPRHPQKFYVSRGNNSFTFNAPTGGGNAKTATVAAGVYTGPEMAIALQNAMNAVSSGVGVTYNTGPHTFTITRAAGLDITGAAGHAWSALGMSNVTNATTTTGAARGAFTPRIVNLTNYSILDINDLWGIQNVDNRKDEIARVRYIANLVKTIIQLGTLGGTAGTGVHYDHGVTYDFTEAEYANLADVVETHIYEIKSRGLIINGGTAGTPWTVFTAPVSGCTPVQNPVSSSYGLDAVDSFAALFAAVMFDRHKAPPIRFKCKMPWRFNTMELGDVVQLTYGDASTGAGEGVFVDRERNSTVLTSRLFEAVSVKPNFDQGCLDVEFLGHRYVSY